MAGLLARLALARKAVDPLEANVLSRLPAYALLKTQTQSMLSPEDIEGMCVVVMRFDDSWQIGFEIERIDRRKVTLCRETLRQAFSEAQMPPRDRGKERCSPTRCNSRIALALVYLRASPAILRSAMLGSLAITR